MASSVPLSSPEKPSAVIRARRTLGAGIHFSPADLLVPLKFGASLSWVMSAQTTLEIEYLRGSISDGIFGLDLFGISDERASLMARSFFGNSFNFHYGVTLFRGSARVSAADIAGAPPASDLWKMEGAGFNAGLGNRWMLTENLSLGLDWISWAQPLWAQQTSDFPQERVASAIRDDFKWVSYFPRIVFLHLQVGAYF